MYIFYSTLLFLYTTHSINIYAAMHLAAVETLDQTLIPAVKVLRETLYSKSIEYNDVVKVGRTHLQGTYTHTYMCIAYI